MKNLLELLTRFLLKDLSFTSQPRGSSCTRVMVNGTAIFFLIAGYVLGCKALYRYAEPYWGEAYSLGALCVLLITTSGALFGMTWLLKPKPSLSKNFINTVEETLSDLPGQDIWKKLASIKLSKEVIGGLALAALAYYLVPPRDKDI